MDRLRRIINNTVISLLGQAVTWTSTLLLTIAYGRFLGDVKFGELFFAITFVLLFGVPLEFGFNQQLTRDVAREPSKALRYLTNTLLIKGAFWLFLYGLILLTCRLLGYNTEVLILVAISGLTLLSTSIMNAFRSLHYAFQRVVFPVVGTILERGLSALFGIILLIHGAGVQAMALVLLGGSIINTLWQALWFFKLTGTRLIIDRVLIRELIRTSIPFMINGALAVIYYRIDTVLLSLMTNAAVVGWYGAGYRLFDTLTFLSNLVINFVMFPVFSKLSVTSEEKLKLAIEKSMNFLLFFGLPMSVGMVVTAPEIIALLYHRAEFSHSVPALQGLAPGLVLLYANTVLSAVIISTKREKKITIIAATALVFNLGLNLFLIPLYQQVGAAVVTALTELLFLCLSLIFVPKRLLPLRSLRVAAKAALASIVMVLAIWLLGTFDIVNFFVILPIAMLVYFASATLLRTIPGEDIRALYSALGQKVHVSRQSLVSQQEFSTMNITDQPTERLPALFAGDQLIDYSAQEIQGSFPEVDTPLPSISLSERELAPGDVIDLSDAYAQTEPRLEVPWWLRSHAASNDGESKRLSTGGYVRDDPK